MFYTIYWPIPVEVLVRLKYPMLCFGENMLQSLMEKNVKVVLNDLKAFSDSKMRDIRASILVPLASQSNVARNAA